MRPHGAPSTVARVLLPLLAAVALVALIERAYAHVLAPAAAAWQGPLGHGPAPHAIVADGADLRVLPPRDGSTSRPAHLRISIAPIAMNLPLLVLGWGWFVRRRPPLLLALAGLLILTHTLQAALEVQQRLGTLPPAAQDLLRFWQGTGWLLLPCLLVAGTLLLSTRTAALRPSRPATPA